MYKLCLELPLFDNMQVFVSNWVYLIMSMFKMSRDYLRVELGFYPDHHLTLPLTKNLINSSISSHVNH